MIEKELWRKERIAWLRRIWIHYAKALCIASMYRTSLSGCLRASIAVIFDRYDDRLLDWRAPEGEVVAWHSLGTYHTDYGTGYAFAYLKVVGFQFAVGEDGSM